MCISNNFRRFTLTELVGLSILNLIHFCLKDGGKFSIRYEEQDLCVSLFLSLFLLYPYC